MSIRVKICGVTTPDDARAAIDAGADLIGLNFVPGTPRVLDLEEAEAVSQSVAGQVERVAVFRDADPAVIDSVLRRIECERVQFHGNETPEAVAAIGRPTIKALKGADPAAARDYPESLLLLDHPAEAAGSGKAWDWSGARGLLASGFSVILAGGLGPDNVGAALRALFGEEPTKPWGVDVASGVELMKRRKDVRKMRDFVNAVREVEASR